MNREEIKAEAKRLGLKVRESWVDDWPENTGWLICGVGIGYLLGRYL